VACFFLRHSLKNVNGRQDEYKLEDFCGVCLPPTPAGLTCSSRPSTSSSLCSSIAAAASSSELNSINANLHTIPHCHCVNEGHGLIGPETETTGWVHKAIPRDSSMCWKLGQGCSEGKKRRLIVYYILLRLQQGYHSLWRIKFPAFPLTMPVIFQLIKLTCNSYFSLHFSRLLLPYTDSLCYHYHILNHWEWKGTEAWRK